MRRKEIGIVLLVTMAVSAFTGCGSGAEPNSADAASSVEDTGSSADDAAKSSTADDGTYTIGATYYTLQTEFCMRMDNFAKKYCADNEYGYVSYDGDNNAATQLEQVETMIANGVDAIILNPQDVEACVSCVDAAVEAGVPMFGVNTRVNSDDLVAYVGSDCVESGEEIMQYMVDYMKSDAFNIVVIEGPMGQSAQLERMQGIENVLDKYPNIKILADDTANWSRSEAMTLMETWLTTYGDEINAVVAQNDEMALGARQAIEDAGMDIPCIGIDGITDAVAAVKEGRLIASDFQDAEGQISGAIDAAIAYLNGKEVEKEIWIPYQMITPDNVQEFENRY